jgi:hypothetical protein
MTKPADQHQPDVDRVDLTTEPKQDEKVRADKSEEGKELGVQPLEERIAPMTFSEL